MIPRLYVTCRLPSRCGWSRLSACRRASVSGPLHRTPTPQSQVLWSEALSSRLHQLAVDGYTVDVAGWDSIEELVRRSITAMPLTTR